MSKLVVFDVESAGLHGEGFAVGAVVLDAASGIIGAEFYAACEPVSPPAWVRDNVLPALSGYTHRTPREVRDAFWSWWKTQGPCELWTDCGWPVEARFLAACIDDDRATREWSGPYPLHEIATALRLSGHDPLLAYGRTPSEHPAHNPLRDARQSARVLWEMALADANARNAAA